MAFRRSGPLKPSAGRGIVLPTQNKPKTLLTAKAYNQPSTVLTRLDRIIKPGASLEICVIRSQGGIGDVLMTLPTVRAIQEKYGGPVDYATDFEYLDGALPAVLKGVPYIRNVIPYRDVQPQLYDAVLDLTCPCVAHEKPHAPPVNRIDLFAKHAGVVLSNFQIDYYPQPEEIAAAKLFLEQDRVLGMRAYKLILVNPSSSTTRRDVPLHVFPRLLRDLMLRNKDARALVFTHYTDCADAKAIDWNNIPGVIQMKDYSVREIAAFMTLCEMVICPDSALLHVAGALDKKTVSFFGPTDPRARINHYPKAVAISPGNGLSCWPCWYDQCKSGLLCWKRLEHNMMLGTLHSVLNDLLLSSHPDLVYGKIFSKNSSYEVL